MTRYILFLLLCFTQYAISLAMPFRHINVKEGLSSRQVFQINKDSAGFIWAYTSIGVDRFDGSEIKHYRLDSMIQSRDHVLSSTIMTCDKKGNIWIAFKNGKIYAYDKRTDSFPLKIDLSHFFSAPVLNNILFDKDNHLWLCMSTGIYYWNFESRKLSLAGLKNICVNCIIQTEKGTFYAGTTEHVYQLKKAVNHFKFSDARLVRSINARIQLLYACGEKIYIGTFSNGVFVFNYSTGKTKSLDDFIPNIPIRSFAKMKNNTILIGADGAGVFQIDMANERLITHLVTDEDDPKSLSGNTVSDICVDEYNGIWISSSTNGISYWEPDTPDVKRIEHEQDNPNSLISDHVNAIIQDSDGDYWYGTNNGVSFYDTKKHEWKHFLNVKGDKYGYSPVVLALCEDYRGNIWVGGYGIGLYSINKRSGEIKKMPKKLKHSGGGISTNYIYSIYAEGDNIWMGGIEGAFTCYNSHTNTYSYYPIDCVGDIKKWNKDSLLIAGCDGLAFFNKSTGKAVWYKNFGDISLHYPIRCLLHASSGDIWLATDGEGLVQFNPINKQARAYTINDGLASNSINSIIEDNVGHIWFNTEKELYCLDPSKGIIINANDFLSISWGYYNPGAALKLRNGNLTFGTAEGAIMFSPSFSLQQNRTVNLIFTNFKLFYQSVKVGAKGSILKANIDQTQKIKLKSEQNSFSISFSAINLVSPYKVRYEYLLEKYQKKWTQTNSVQSVNYMDLPPGKYIFRVKAFDKYTQQKLGERCLEIIISPPFWLSWWAFFIYFVIISAFVFLFVQAKRHQISENRIKDKIRLFIGFAHDIRTPVTLIKAPLSELDGKEDIPEKYKKNISVAVKNVDKLFEMLTQLLNLQKVETHQEGLDITLNDIGEYLRDKISEFRIAARHKGLDIVLQIEPNMFEVWFDKNKMDHIMDNLLSNALKYTEKGFICVAVKKSRKTWSIEVKDTGVGIPKGEQNNIFHEYYRAKNAINSVEEGIGIGLMITRRIVRQHRGKISFSSVENGGTTFVVTLPLKINSNLIAKTENNMELLSTDASQETPVNKNILLLAEDDKDMREYLTSSLASEYQVISVDDGGKALEKAREINPDIIISDIMMPILQGDELCRILKSSVETSHIPIILLTALSERENIILGLESGANDYIIKPFDLSVLKVRLRNILQSRQHLREMVFSLNTTLGEENYTTQLDKEFLDKAMEIMNAELANPDFSINDFCRMIGMSRTSVYNKIKTLTGQGPNDYIRIIRLNKSKELLLSHRFPVAEVSSMVGFSDPKYFSTCFKKQFKISPSKI